MKIIGIVSRSYYNKDNQEIFQFYEKVRNVLSKYNDVIFIGLMPQDNDNYFSDELGNDKINKTRLDYLLSLCDGFVMPGGTFFHNFDDYIINYAISNDKPLFSICLGFQCLCMNDAKERISFNLNSKIEDNSHYDKPNIYKHSVTLNKESKLYSIIGKDKINVNSIHHHTVKFEMKNLIISAMSDDNIIEAVEYPNKKFIVGVQWHPEYLLDENSNKLFNAFINSL